MLVATLLVALVAGWAIERSGSVGVLLDAGGSVVASVGAVLDGAGSALASGEAVSEAASTPAGPADPVARPGRDGGAADTGGEARTTPLPWTTRLARRESRSERARSAARHGSGELRVAPGGSRPSTSGPPRTYAVEVERGIGVPPRRFAAAVERTLADRRGWEARGLRAFRRVDEGPASLRVTLASPATTDRLCAPLVTRGTYSCFQRGRAVLNVRRWLEGARGYRGRLREYRAYMINHEVGHGLGLGHAACPRRGARAPLMLQQTKGLGGCRPGYWPLSAERDVAR